MYFFKKKQELSSVAPQSTNDDIEGSPDHMTRGVKQLSVLLDGDGELRDVEAPVANALKTPPHRKRPTRITPADSDDLQLADKMSGQTPKAQGIEQRSSNERSRPRFLSSARATQPTSKTEPVRQNVSSFGEDDLEVMKSKAVFDAAKRKKSISRRKENAHDALMRRLNNKSDRTKPISSMSPIT